MHFRTGKEYSAQVQALPKFRQDLAEQLPKVVADSTWVTYPCMVACHWQTRKGRRLEIVVIRVGVLQPRELGDAGKEGCFHPEEASRERCEQEGVRIAVTGLVFNKSIADTRRLSSGLYQRCMRV